LNLEEFTKNQINSLIELRALLLLHNRLEADWNALEIAQKLNLEPSRVAGALPGLVTKGLLATTGEPPRYRYEPQSAALADWVSRLAEMDRFHPVTLINLIAPLQVTSPHGAPLSSSPTEEGN